MAYQANLAPKWLFTVLNHLKKKKKCQYTLKCMIFKIHDIRIQIFISINEVVLKHSQT